MCEIKVGDLVKNIQKPELDYRRVMAIGGGLLTLDFGGVESGFLPVELFQKVEPVEPIFEKKGFNLVTINSPLSPEDAIKFSHYIEDIDFKTLEKMRNKISECEPVRFFMNEQGEFYLSENGKN